MGIAKVLPSKYTYDSVFAALTWIYVKNVKSSEYIDT